MPKHSDAVRFLQAVYPEWRVNAIFAHSTAPKGMSHCRDGGFLDETRDCYWSIASFPAGGSLRTLARAVDVRALVIDDVGTKVAEGAVRLALGEPTAIVETSAGNCQWGYRLTTPVPVAAWPGVFAGVEKLIGQKLEGRDAVHLFRLPMGVNTKAGRGGFAVRLVAVNDIEIEVGRLADMGNSKTFSANPPMSAGGGGGLGLEALTALMGLIPNTLDARDEWIEAGHGIKALCDDDADGYAVFNRWSSQHASYDEEKTRAAWDSFGTGGLKTQGGRLRARAERADPAGFASWDARRAFDDGVVHPAARRPVAFSLGTQGQILSTMENAARGLWGLGVECTYDEFHHRFYVRGERLTDHMVLLLRVEINSAYGKDFGDKHLLDAITALGLKNGFNPVRAMLDAAERDWDGVKRLDRLGPDYFHSEDTALARECFRKVMLAAVRRARRPGCKFDQILVLESPEGWDKSTAWAVLAGEENFSDAGILGKDARAVQEELADVWIHEIADLSGLARAEVEHVKAFASRQVDRARPAYGKVLIDQPRQSIEVGTTNSDSYLHSQTGNRRFWPFALSARVDTARLRADRLLLWGEAARAESSGESLVLSEALWSVAAAAQEDRRVVDVWEDELENLPDALVHEVGEYRLKYQTITNVAIHEYLSGHRGGHVNGAAGRKIAEIMKRLGWERTYLKDAVGKKVRGYRRATDSHTSVSPSVPKNLF